MELLLGFLGGLVAVALKGWIDYVLEARRELRTLRAAARQLADDLGRAAVQLDSIIEWRRWHPAGHDMGVASWDESRSLLAAVMDNRAWHQLSMAVGSARYLAGALKHHEDQVLTDEEEQWLREEAQVLRGLGYARLAELGGRPSSAHRPGRLLLRLEQRINRRRFRRQVQGGNATPPPPKRSGAQ